MKQFTHNEKTTIKILTVNAGEELSLQYHKHRDEFWKVLSGKGQFQIEDIIYNVEKDDEFFVNRTVIHRIRAKSSPIVVLEISFGDFDENDIVRLEDKYNR